MFSYSRVPCTTRFDLYNFALDFPTSASNIVFNRLSCLEICRPCYAFRTERIAVIIIVFRIRSFVILSVRKISALFSSGITSFERTSAYFFTSL